MTEDDNSNYRAVIHDALDGNGLICVIVKVEQGVDEILVCALERFVNKTEDDINNWIREQMKTKPWETRQ